MPKYCRVWLGVDIKGVSPSFIKLTSLLNVHSPNYARLYGQLHLIINHIQQGFSLSETQSEKTGDPPVENHCFRVNTFHPRLSPLEGHHLPVSAKSCGQTCRLGWWCEVVGPGFLTWGQSSGEASGGGEATDPLGRLRRPERTDHAETGILSWRSHGTSPKLGAPSEWRTLRSVFFTTHLKSVKTGQEVKKYLRLYRAMHGRRPGLLYASTAEGLWAGRQGGIRNTVGHFVLESRRALAVQLGTFLNLTDREDVNAYATLHNQSVSSLLGSQNGLRKYEVHMRHRRIYTRLHKGYIYLIKKKYKLLL